MTGCDISIEVTEEDDEEEPVEEEEGEEVDADGVCVVAAVLSTRSFAANIVAFSAHHFATYSSKASCDTC